MRPRLLDLFCGAGGAGMGYHRAGFDVVGVDIAPQPHYPFEFHQADALTFPFDVFGFAAVHASPPCQEYSVTRSLHRAEYPTLVEAVRARLLGTGLRYVIENVVGAPLTNCVTLCGSSFGLGVRRHRRFETNWTVWSPPQCRHDLQPAPIDVTGGGPTKPWSDTHDRWCEPQAAQHCRSKCCDGYRLDVPRRAQRGNSAGVHRVHRRAASRCDWSGRVSVVRRVLDSLARRERLRAYREFLTRGVQ